jgi:diguanylate cyclase (GGDEF)-like protein
MEKETFFLFVMWGILGFIFFRNILRRDKAKRFGKSLIVWIGLLSMVLLISLIWMSQSMMSSTNTAMENIHSYYISEGDVSSERAEDEAFIETQIGELRAANGRTIFVATGMFAFSLMILLTNYTYMNRRQRESEEALGHARAIAYNDPLTGVKNKRAFTDREKEMDDHIKAWSEASSDQEGASQTEPVPPFAVLVADLNGLKHINDTYGHKAGDEYIRSASRLICESFQHSPVYRIGGDEFVVLLSGRDYENRDTILSDFNRTVEANIGTDNVVVAAGISDYAPGHDGSVHAVFERADNLMYTRKQQLKSMGARSR